MGNQDQYSEHPFSEGNPERILKDLSRTRRELEETRQLADMITETVREALLVLTSDLRVHSSNRAFYQTFQTTPEVTVGTLIYDLDGGRWNTPGLRQLLEDILPVDSMVSDCEIRDLMPGAERCFLFNARRVGARQWIVLAIEDITDWRREERKLRESEERFQLLLENATEYAIFILDEENRITMWNPGAERILGWSKEEVLGLSGEIVFTREDRENGVPEKELQRAKSDGSALDERWHIRKDNSRFWASGALVALRDSELRGFAKILRDNTQQKEIEEEREKLLQKLTREQARLRELNLTLEARVEERTRQVRALASTLTMAEQQERRRISQVLHDELQQYLYGIQMRLVVLNQVAEAQEQAWVTEHVQNINDWLEDAITTTRNMTVNLSPPVLKNEGLSEALGWLISQMHIMHGLLVDLKVEPVFRVEDEDMRVLLFQIVRELLFNVVKHAGVLNALVEIRRLDNVLFIRVADRGTGFDLEEMLSRTTDESGFGLFSVRERLHLFGGNMTVETAPGKGTSITITLPTFLSIPQPAASAD